MNFPENNRGVSGVVGFVLILGIVVILLSIYQAQGVPAQNSQVEFDHSISVAGDLQELRSTQITAAADGSTRSSSVKLGVTYPSRSLFINPPDPQGRLETTVIDNGTYMVNGQTMKQACGFDESVTSKAIEYSADYNYFSESEIPPYTLENSVLYENLPSGQRLINSNQTLVSGDSVHLFVVTSHFSESGVKATPVDFHATTGGKKYQEKLNISIPTKLSRDQWSDLVPQATVIDQPGDRVRIETDTTTLRCSAIGIGESSSVTPVGGEGEVEINPAGPNEVALNDVTRSDGDVTVSFTNTGNRDTNITHVRMPFVKVDKQNVQGSSLDPYDVVAGGTLRAENYEIGDELRPVEPWIALPGNNTDTSVTFSFDNAGNDFNNGGFIVITAEFETGEKGTYFLDIVP